MKCAYRSRNSILTALQTGLLAITILLTPSVIAAETTTAPEAKQTEAILPFDTPAEQFTTRLRPLTEGELSTELKAWIKHAQKEFARTSEISIQIQSYNEDSANEGTEIPKELKQQQSDQLEIEYHLHKKLNYIIQALEAKGGDASAEKQYLKAITFDNSGSNEQSFTMVLFSGISSWIKDPDGWAKFLKKLIGAAAILFLFWFLAKLANGFIKKILGKQRTISEMLKHFIERSVKSVVLFIGGLFALASLGVEIGPILAAMGAGGFIIGFALKETLGNFASGLMVMFYQPFDVGHFVEVSGTSGSVQKMSLVSTTLLTPDNKELIIPNTSVWGNTIINYSSQNLRRVDLVFGISYGDDIQQAVTLLNELTGAHKLILESPEPEIAVDALADSSVNLICRPWVKSADYWIVFRELMWQVKDRFDQEGISIPFPQQDVYMHPIALDKNGENEVS